MAQYSPIDQFWQVIKGKYKAKILICLNDRTLRYHQIQKKFEDASERILIKQLKELEADGLLVKTIRGHKPPFQTEYELSAYGKTICPLLKQMWAWGEKHRRMDAS
ncbi:MAG TPA: helix-turn-helix domain-containing protein [Flavisolibacter sp.]|jgi:DNA-binding HxlR family transcriptional regulator|nr:helix-turn-helix domain-containing protein [Flavisolibacter sp.]